MSPWSVQTETPKRKGDKVPPVLRVALRFGWRVVRLFVVCTRGRVMEEGLLGIAWCGVYSGPRYIMPVWRFQRTYIWDQNISA